MLINFFICSFFTMVAAVAHDSGHGQAIEGLGPHGGKLAPIIFAKEAELGTKAKTQAVAEWVKKGHVIEVYFLNSNQDKSFEIKGPSDIKWILLGEKLGKPEVIKSALVSNQRQITYSFAPEVINKVDKIEVILPNLGDVTEKSVVSFSLN